ncbi:cadherin-like domain-containing protein [Paracoccus sp. TK19116]|uniref:Cadherin-like domain-containing protein n=1 Tax=Paracoccus albicereus TaxID=2922394 RepID=A0ABT1MQV7_9RHOB|nr:cadherin-like domain-containing protein [Paracoccus albicereus]MCQ0969906.1 cadherin-like domain-containing protein [Paracoccus albicereus]
MIKIKGFRPRDDASDPADPLGLKDEGRGGAKVLSGFVIGMSALALYLKSFLWPSAETVQAAEAGVPASSDEDVSAAVGRSVVVPSHRRSIAPDAEATPDPGEPTPKNGAALSMASFGFVDLGVIVPPDVVKMSIGLPQFAANTPLPPFFFEEPAGQGSSSRAPSSSRMPSVGSETEDTPPTDPSPTDPEPFEPTPSEPNTGEPKPDRPEPVDPVTDDDGERETDEPDEADRNRAPRNTGPIYLGDVGSGATLAIALSHLLANTVDPDGDMLTVTDLGSGKGIWLSKDFGWRYLADPDELGEVTVTYTISDGVHEVQQIAYLNVVENEFDGSEDDDLIVATDGRDVIRAGGGDDNIVASGGRDIIRGDAGDDLIAGGAGADTIWGGDGDDVIAGGAGDDWMSGGGGNDRLYGEEGDDVLSGDAGDDHLDGGEGADVIDGGEGADTLLGQRGDDILRGGKGTDHLDGGNGDDLLSGGEGADTVRGGAGHDHVVADDDAAADVYAGDGGYDTLDYSAATAPVVIDIANAVAVGESVGSDTFAGFEHYVGSTGADTFQGGAGEATVTGNGGADEYCFDQGDFVEIPPSQYRIADFGFDDMISITGGGHEKQIRKAQKSLEDRIEDFFEDVTEDASADEPRLRFSHDWTDDYRFTLIEVDFDHDRITDLEIRLDGELRLVTEYA